MLSGQFQLEDQIVLVTGGSQGLGRQFAYKYYHETKRTKIIVVSRSRDKLKSVVEDIEGEDTKEPGICLNYNGQPLPEDRRIFYLPCDLSDFTSVQGMFNILIEHQLSPTVILSCVGGSIPKLFKDLTPKELELGIHQNYKSVVTLTHTFLQRYQDLQSASITTSDQKLEDYRCHIVLFSSEVSFFPFIGYGQYAPLKVAMKALVSILRQEILSPEFGKDHIRLSCVYPGNFHSEGYELEELTKPAITKEIEGPSSPISCNECCDKIIYWLNKGYDDVTTDAIGWILMAVDMGLNKNNNKSFLYWLQLLVGIFANLIIVPIYMLVCQWQINQYFKKSEQPDKDKKQM